MLWKQFNGRFASFCKLLRVGHHLVLGLWGHCYDVFCLFLAGEGLAVKWHRCLPGIFLSGLAAFGSVGGKLKSACKHFLGGIVSRVSQDRSRLVFQSQWVGSSQRETGIFFSTEGLLGLCWRNELNFCKNRGFFWTEELLCRG